jgi:dTDP-glucose 4,6-dehydratase
MQTLVITGGAGFIGSNFVRYLLGRYPEYKIHVLDALTYAGNKDNLKGLTEDSRFEFTHGDIRDSAVVEQVASRADAIINFAAESHVDRSILNPGAFIQTDVAGVWTLLEAARKHKHERFLHVSTDEVYGSVEKGSSKETDLLEPNSPYSASKAGGELQVRAYHKTFGLPTVVTRGSNTYGPYQYPEKLVPLFVTNLIDDQPVPVYGDGMQKRDWLYVLDHCQAIDLAFHKGEPGGIYNIGGENERPNIEVVNLMLKTLGKPESLIRHVLDRPGHDLRYCVDNAKIKALGYKSSGEFEEQFHQTVQWYVDNQPWWRQIKAKPTYQEFMQTWYKDRK